MRPDVLPMTPKRSEIILNGLVRSPRPKRLKFQRSRIKTMLIIFLDSQGVVHKEFVLEGKTVNAEFYKGVMDRLLKCIQRFRPAALEIFSFCTIMRPPTKLQVFAHFDPPKMLQPLITLRTLQIYLRKTIFCSPS
jgi:hypothetical protein